MSKAIDGAIPEKAVIVAAVMAGAVKPKRRDRREIFQVVQVMVCFGMEYALEPDDFKVAITNKHATQHHQRVRKGGCTIVVVDDKDDQGN
jgi:hypothetical protein